MNHKTIALLAVLALVPVVMAATYVNSIVGVCDAATPANCLKPNVDGSLNVGATITGTITVAPASGSVTVTAATVGVASASVLAAGTRKYLFMQNVSATASVACRPDNGTAALNTAGSFMLTPGGSRTWEGSATPNGQINCIASAASTPVTIETL